MASVSSHVVYVGDHTSVDDLLAFWNMRATGREVWFAPITHLIKHRLMLLHTVERGRYAINAQVENHADIQRAPSISEEAFTSAVEHLKELPTGAISIRIWQPRYGFTADFYAGDIHAADLEAARGDEQSILSDGRMTPVNVVDPPYLDASTSALEHEWAIELQIGNPYGTNDLTCHLPNAPGADALVRQVVIGGNERRLGRNGIVVTESLLRGRVSISPVRTFDVFSRMLHAATSLDISPSHPGSYAAQIIRRMGSLEFECRVFKIRGVRQIIDRLSRGAALTKGNMYDIVMSTTPDAFGVNWRPDLNAELYINRGQPATEFSAIFNELLAKRVIRPGLTFACGTCQKEVWYHVTEFGEEYTCRFCFERQRVAFGSRAEWQYRADGMFQIENSAQGSLATILALWRLAHVGHSSDGRYATGLNFCRANGSVELEIDYCYLLPELFGSSYEFVLGEAKNFVDFDDAAVARMTALADRFAAKPYIAFGTLKDTFSDDEKKALRGAIDRGYRVIPMTRLELDPYDLHDRFANTPYKYAVSLCDLAEGCAAVNL